jgi:hypothetical protein
MRRAGARTRPAVPFRTRGFTAEATFFIASRTARPAVRIQARPMRVSGITVICARSRYSIAPVTPRLHIAKT